MQRLLLPLAVGIGIGQARRQRQGPGPPHEVWNALGVACVVEAAVAVALGAAEAGVAVLLGAHLGPPAFPLLATESGDKRDRVLPSRE